jgi:nucleotide-binding universal stress UspA family protein
MDAARKFSRAIRRIPASAQPGAHNRARAAFRRGDVLAHPGIIMLNIRHILCPIDLTDSSLRALAHASALAEWYEASVTALFVDTALRIEGVTDLREFAIAPPSVVGVASPSRAQDEVRAFVARVPCRTGVGVIVEESTHVEGAILEQAQALPADLLVMASHGRSGVERLLLGSVTEHVLRAAPCPVMVVPPHDIVPTSVVLFKHIVCAVDFSESSLAALTWALSLAEESDARLSLVHVIEVPPELRVSTVVTDRQIDELHAVFEAETLSRLRSLVPTEATTWCSVETATASGAAGQAVLTFAADRNGDLIVMGAQGHGAVDRLLFGSKTRDVVCGATCPVLTVRP